MSSYDEAYHPPSCTCDLPPGPISVQEFLRSCFYPRLLKNKENRKELTIGGYDHMYLSPEEGIFWALSMKIQTFGMQNLGTHFYAWKATMPGRVEMTKTLVHSQLILAVELCPH